MTASAHVLVFRPLIQLLRTRGDEVEITARDYAQTLQLLELHGLEATVIGHHGGRSRLCEGRPPPSPPRALRQRGRPRELAGCPPPRGLARYPCAPRAGGVSAADTEFGISM